MKVVAGEAVEERCKESENHEFQSVNRDSLNLSRDRRDFTNSLGLFICQKILSSSGGSIQVSTEDKSIIKISMKTEQLEYPPVLPEEYSLFE